MQAVGLKNSPSKPWNRGKPNQQKQQVVNSNPSSKSTGAKRNRKPKNQENGGSSTDINRSLERFRTNAPPEVGFKPRVFEKRPIPHYLANSTASNIGISRSPDPWDLENQQRLLQIEAQYSGSGGDMQTLYEKFQQMRDMERSEMEKRGLVDRQDVRKKLQDAILFVGSCNYMCPTFERVRRTYENNVKELERDPITKKPSKEYAVKAFSRPAAGQPPPLPSDVRPPHVLVSTLDYLVEKIVPELPAGHSFLWDRTRSIRQDFTYQNYTGIEAIECNERIARIHLICLHIMPNSDVDWSRQQELEQLTKTLQTLSELYTDARKRNIVCPNEPELRSYQLLSHLRDSEVENQVQDLPIEVFNDPRIQQALYLRSLIKLHSTNRRSVYSQLENMPSLFVVLFKALARPTVSFLMACLVEVSFTDIRLEALKDMSKSYHSRGKPYVVSRLSHFLGFDDDLKTIEFCQHYEIPIIQDLVPCVDIKSFNESVISSKQPPKSSFSMAIVDSKKGLKSLKQIINENSPLTIVKRKVSEAKSVPKEATPVSFIPRVATASSTHSVPSIPSLTSVNTSSPAFSFGFKPAATNPFVKTTEMPSTLFSSPTTDPPKTISNSAPLFPTSKPEPLTTRQSSFKSPAAQPPASSTPPIIPSSTILVDPVSFSGATLPTPQSFKSAPKSSLLPNVLPASLQTAREQPLSKVASPPSARVKSIYSENTLRHATFLATQSIIRQLISNTVIPKSWKTLVDARQARTSMIESVALFGFERAVESLLTQQVMESVAVDINRRRILKNALKKIRLKAHLAKIKEDNRLKRLEEVKQVSKLLGKSNVARRTSSRHWGQGQLNDQDYEAVVEKTRQIVSDLWKPLDLEALLPLLVNEGISSQQGIYDSKVYVGVYSNGWNETPGTFLRNKLQIDKSLKSTEYLVRDNYDATETTVVVTPLQEDQASYEYMGVIVIECGIHDIEFDRACVWHIIELVESVSLYRLNVMLLWWGDQTLKPDDIASTIIKDMDFVKKNWVDMIQVCKMDEDDAAHRMATIFKQTLVQWQGHWSMWGEQVYMEQVEADKKAKEAKAKEEKRARIQAQNKKAWNIIQHQPSLKGYFTKNEDILEPVRTSSLNGSETGSNGLSDNSPLSTAATEANSLKRSLPVPKAIQELRDLVQQVKRSRSQ